MTGINAWPAWIALIFAAAPILLAFVSMAYGRYLYCCHLPALMEAMKNSRYVYIGGRSLQKQGWYGSGMVIATFTGMIMFPKSAIQMGNLNPMDLENFPPYLKRRLLTHGAMNLVSLVWAGILYFLIDLDK